MLITEFLKKYLHRNDLLLLGVIRVYVLFKIILDWSRECQGHVDILALSNKLSKLPDVRYHHPKQIKIQKPGRTQSDLYILDMHIDALDIHLGRKLFFKIFYSGNF